MKYLLLLALVLGLVACDTEVKKVDSCGDGFIDPGEACDGAELGGLTCGSLEYYNVTGELACLPDCSLDVTACGGRCGDNTVDAADGEQCDGENLNSATCATLNYTNGGVLACDAQCRFDASACLTTCGNGNLEPGEPCDDGALAAGDGCAADCTVEPGWECEGETVSTCAPICSPGLSFCDGECFDLANDPGHCGTCEKACEANQRCLGSICSPNDAPWADAGTFAAFQPNTSATRYAITACEGGPLVLAVNTAGDTFSSLISQLTGMNDQWIPLPELDFEIPENSSLEAGLGLACAGQEKYVVYSLANSDPELVVRRFDTAGSSWVDLSSVPLLTQCANTTFISALTDETGHPHVITRGSGSCSMGVDYGWWDGAIWQSHPSMGGHPRQLTDMANGDPSIVMFGETLYIGIAESYEMLDWQVRHVVWTWDGSWQQVGPQLDSEQMLNNGQENISLAVGPEGWLCAAYETNLTMGVPIPDRLIEVKCYDPGSDTWVRLGAGEVNVGHNAAAPSLVFLGTRPVLAYQQSTRVADQDVWVIRVVRWDPEGESWEELGTVTGINPEEDAHRPTLVSQEGRLFLAFLFGDDESYQFGVQLYVKEPAKAPSGG